MENFLNGNAAGTRMALNVASNFDHNAVKMDENCALDEQVT